MNDFGKLYERLDQCRYAALAIQDFTTESIIRELCDIMMELVEIMELKETKYEGGIDE